MTFYVKGSQLAEATLYRKNKAHSATMQVNFVTRAVGQAVNRSQENPALRVHYIHHKQLHRIDNKVNMIRA